MNNPTDLRYTEEHEWARLEDDGTITVGITHHAQEALGDVVFVELPEEGAELEEGAIFGVVESVKAVSDLFAPCSGTVEAPNEEVVDRPELVNGDPFEEGWLLKINPTDTENALAGMMDAAAYDAFLESES